MQRWIATTSRSLLLVLIALGLALFLLTFILNGLARLLIVVTTQKRSEVAA